jgi:hypothetical protein
MARCGAPDTYASPWPGVARAERRQKGLAMFMCTQGTLMVLDEPTNHLDIPSKEMLEEAVRQFQGAVIAVSHDRCAGGGGHGIGTTSCACGTCRAAPRAAWQSREEGGTARHEPPGCWPSCGVSCGVWHQAHPPPGMHAARICAYAPGAQHKPALAACKFFLHQIASACCWWAGVLATRATKNSTWNRTSEPRRACLRPGGRGCAPCMSAMAAPRMGAGWAAAQRAHTGAWTCRRGLRPAVHPVERLQARVQSQCRSTVNVNVHNKAKMRAC